MKRLRSDSNRIKNIIKNSIAASCLGVAILIYGCENDLEEIKAFGSTDNLPVLEAINFETQLTDSGVVRYFLKAPRLLKFEIERKEFVEFPEGMELIQYDPNKKVVSSLRSDYAKQFVKEKRWEANNNVIATNLDGDTLKTEHLIWEEKTKQVYTEEFVQIIRADGIYTGIGLVADESLDNWRIKKLKGIVYLEMDDAGNSSAGSSGALPSKGEVNKPFDSPLQINK